MLKLNSAGPAVRGLQQLINTHYGATVLTIDGVFGPLTDEVVRTVQREHGLTVDGVAGPKTLEALSGHHGEGPHCASKPASTGAVGSTCHGCVIRRSRRTILELVVHCSATREGQDVSVSSIRRSHLAQGWSDIGYHYVIGLDGTVYPGRDVDLIGAHVTGHNTYSLGICYVGGTDAKGRAKDTRTAAQREALRDLLRTLHACYPEARICGHRDFSPDLNFNGKIEPFEYIKACPCFDAEVEYRDI